MSGAHPQPAAVPAAPMTGARGARGLAAALLAAPLLFAAAPAGAHIMSNLPHFHARMELDGMTALTVTEGQSATVGIDIRCQSSCKPGAWYGPSDYRNQSAWVDVELTTTPASAGGAAFAGADENKRLRYTIASTFANLNFNAPDPANGTVMLEIPDNENADGDRTVSVSTTFEYEVMHAFWSSSFTQPYVVAATLTILDDDPVPLTVVESGGDTAVSEDGTRDDFEVSLGGDPRAAVLVAVSSQDAGECEVSLDGGATYLEAGASGTLTFVPDGEDDSAARTSEWDEAQRVTVRGVDDAAGDGAQQCAVRLDPSSPGAMGDARYEAQESVEVLVTNADNEVAATLLLTPSSIVEGGTATVSATLPAPAASAVTLTVSAAPGTGASAGDFTQTGTTLTIAAGATASTEILTIAAADDDVDGPESKRVTVSATSSGGENTVNPADAALTITDDDASPRVALALAPARIAESGPGNAARVTAALSRPSSMATTVTVSAAAGVTVGADNVLSIPAGATASADAVTLTAVDDEEQGSDREVAVSGWAENLNGVEQPEAVTLTIRDDDGSEAVTAVLLPEAARAMADSRAGAVRRRLESADAAAAEMASLPGLLAEHGPSLQEDGLDGKTALAGSSFALPLNAAGGGGAGGGVTVWGSGDYRDLDGEARGVSWDGDVVSGHLGLDRKLASGLRVGLAASWSEAKFDYGHKSRKGEWKLEMGSAQPYLGWTTPGGLELWASAGAGRGELEVTEGRARDTSDADMRMAAAGARGPLYATASGLRVSLRGEALYSSFEVDGNGARIPGYTADVSRLRLALEARRDRALASGARLSPRFELGLRHDGGDGETGAGVELGGGAEYASGRLSASGGARALVANSDYDEWGADLALAYAPGADGRGFSFRLAPSWGAAQSGGQKLWEQGAPGLNGAAEEPDSSARLEAELGYGLKSPWSRGLLTLTLGGEAGEDAGAACRLKGAVALDATATLGLELEVRDPPSGGAERSLMATAELRF